MDVMENNTLEINYDSNLLDLIAVPYNFVNENTDVILSDEVEEWLVENNIMYEYQFTWHRENFPYRLGPGHAELTFENNQDMSAFILRWM